MVKQTAHPPRQWRARYRAVAASSVVFGALVAAGTASGLDLNLISIGTGGRTGVYYLAGGAICALVNAGRWQHGIRCITESTEGSIENLKAIRSGEATLGIVQSDWQYHGVQGTGLFESVGPDSDLRSLFSLFPEPFTVVARPDANISELADLEGKRVDVGPAGSGGRATMSVVMDALGWTAADFAYVSEYEMDDLPGALCGGAVDAAVFTIAHPNLTVEDMMTACDARLVPVQRPEIDRLVEANPYYFWHEIPAGTYPGQAASVAGFALGATVVTSSRVSPVIVNEVVQAVFENLAALREAHPAMAELDGDRMISDGLSAPLHRAAIAYFGEIGLQSSEPVGPRTSGR